MNPKPFNTSYLPEKDGHKVHYAQYGNPNGEAVVTLHGGPGSKSKAKHVKPYDLGKFKGKVKFVWGNNEAERVGITGMMDTSEQMELCGDTYEAVIDGVRIFMNHYPRFVELAAKSGEFDLCIFGHTHEYYNEMVGNCLLINPSEIQGYKTGISSFVVFDTQTKYAAKITVS